MNALETLKAIKDKFFAPAPVVVPAAPAEAAAPAPAPAPAAKTYKLQDGTEIAIAQAGETPAVGDAVTVAGAPAPAGVHTLEDGATITVDEAGVITAYTPAAPVTNDMSTAPAPVAVAPVIAPTPTLMEDHSEKFSAIDIELVKVYNLITAQQNIIAKYEETIKGLFEIVEQVVTTPTADPATLTGEKKERFVRYSEKHEQSLNKFSKALKTLKS
jgi:hypothetical protein